MRRWMVLAGLLLGSITLGGCGPGYLHSHPHQCPSGDASSHRHWHSDDGFEGHHAREPGSPGFHREMTWSD